MNNLTPQQAAEELLTLSEKQSRLSDEYADLEEKKLRHFASNRGKYKSDKACENDFLASEDGIKHMRLGLELKKLSREMSVLKVFLRHEEVKARNLY